MIVCFRFTIQFDSFPRFYLMNKTFACRVNSQRSKNICYGFPYFSSTRNTVQDWFEWMHMKIKTRNVWYSIYLELFGWVLHFEYFVLFIQRKWICLFINILKQIHFKKSFDHSDINQLMRLLTTVYISSDIFSMGTKANRQR